MQHIAANLVPPFGGDAGATQAGQFPGSFLLPLGEQPGAQDPHCVVAVLMLGAFRLAGHHDAGGQVGEAHRGGYLLDILAAGAAGAKEVHFDFVGADGHFGVVVRHRGQGFDAGKGGLAAAGGVKGRNAYQPVYADLGVEAAEGAGAADFQGAGAQAGFVAVGRVQHL